MAAVQEQKPLSGLALYSRFAFAGTSDKPAP